MHAAGSLVNARTGDIVVRHLYIADRFWPRFRGLQFRRPLAEDEGLLLVPCNAIHTFFIRFTIDAAFLDETGTVIEVRRVPPWRIVPPVKGGRAVVELAAGGERCHRNDVLAWSSPALPEGSHSVAAEN